MSQKSKPFRLPGFGLTLGITLLYLSLIVLLPLAAVFIKTAGMSFHDFWEVVASPRVVASYKLSFGASFFGAVINVFFGTIVAWVLVRYDFPGKRFMDAVVDLPFALPTAVAGIALTTIYAPKGWIGALFEPFGIKIAFTQLGVLLALTFVSLPFMIRTLQPVIEELQPELEEASASLGASRMQTLIKVVIPELFPAILMGFALSFARALGEYGSVVFISGNMPMKTEITPLMIITKLEQYDVQGATAIATVMLVSSFAMLLTINTLQKWSNWRNRV